MSSDPMLPSVPRVSGLRTPWSQPNETPSAPGNVPKRLSKVRFSLIRKTTCLIGQRVPPAWGPDVWEPGEADTPVRDGLGAPEAEPDAWGAAEPPQAAETNISASAKAVVRSC